MIAEVVTGPLKPGPLQLYITCEVVVAITVAAWHEDAGTFSVAVAGRALRSTAQLAQSLPLTFTLLELGCRVNTMLLAVVTVPLYILKPEL